jgi:thiamine-phosphate pyrophosphorylase
VPSPDRLASLADARLYLCTPARPDLAEFLDECLAAGVDVVQLREKGLTARQEFALCEVVATAAARYDVLWAVNDRADLAFVARPDALHLGQDDLPVPAARHLIGEGLLVGRSVHDLQQAEEAAQARGVDYLFVGPSLPTPTRPAREAAGLDLVRAVAELAPRRPWFADGGVTDLDALEAVIEAGARRVVVVRALTEARDPGSVAAAMKARLLDAASASKQEGA